MMYIEMLLLNALMIAGFKLATEEGMIFAWLQHISMPKWVAYPLYACATCMSSLWSLPVFYWAYGIENAVLWPAYVLALAATSTLVYSVIDRLSK